MSTLSKNELPSLYAIALMAIVRSCYLVLLYQAYKHNLALLKHACNSGFPVNFKQAISQTHKGIELFALSNKKECRTLVPIGTTNPNQLQKMSASKKFEICVVANQTINGDVLIGLHLKSLQPKHDQNERPELFGFALVESKNPFLKGMEPLYTKSRMVSPLLQQYLLDTKKHSKYSNKSTEKSILPKVSENNDESGKSDNLVKKFLMRKFKICFACRELVQRKRFFDERRFGVLENCDCVVCYGCIRKASGTFRRVVQGTVCCPSCSIASDTVASAGKWIEGVEKVQFLETFRNDMHISVVSWLDSAWDLTDLPEKSNKLIRQQNLVPVH